MAEKVGIGKSCVVITGTSLAKATLNFWELSELGLRRTIQRLRLSL